MLPLPPLFRLRPLLTLAEDAQVRLAAGRPVGGATIAALVLESGPLLLLWLRPRGPPEVRQVDWPDEAEKRVEAVCFSPCGGWLLVAVSAGALYVLPALSLLGAPPPPPTGRLSATDATAYPPAAHATRPTAVVWWRRGHTDYAVVGGGQGEIEFIELGAGDRVGGTYVRRAITRLDIVQEPLEGHVQLLISSGTQQWRLLLEKTGSDYVVPLDALQSAAAASDSESTSEMVKAKLNNLRQMSREKLGSLQARWAESRLFRRSVQRDETGACGSSSGGAGNTSSGSSVASSDTAADTPDRQRTPKPENVTNVLGGMLVEPQVLRMGDVLAGQCATTGTLTVHLTDLEAVPLSIHKLPPSVGSVLVTDSVIFATDVDCSRLFLISYSFSQCDMDVLRFNEDSVLSVFDLVAANGLVALFPTSERTVPAPAKLRPYLTVLPQTPLRGCVLVTRRGVSVCEPRASPEASLLEVGMAASPTCSAGAHLLDRLHKLFPVNVSRLYETLGDMKLAEREFTQALAYYRLTKKPHMAVVHKFAARGYSSQLLHYATILLSGVSEGLLLSDRRRLSDLALLAHLETVLRSGSESDAVAFTKLLHSNRHYSAGLAVQFCLLAQQWAAVGFLLTERRQHQRLLFCLTQAQPPVEDGDEPLRQPDVYDVGLRCVLLARPRLAAKFVLRLLEVVPSLPAPILHGLCAITDPLSADLRPLTHCLLDHHAGRRSSSESNDVTTDPVTSQNPAELQPLQPDDLVDLHLHVLLHLARAGGGPQRARVLPESEESTCRVSGVTADWPAVLSAGFSHAALCRRGELLVWGENSAQCLGDPELTQEVAAPKLVDHLTTLGVAVIRAACGRAHTLALTTNGVYSWGSGRLGQLGLGSPGTCPYPRLVPALAYRRVLALAAGQYHSLALSDEGRLLAWGWNVFGQCGSAAVGDVQSPSEVCGVEGRVTAIAAGYAHSAALTDDGRVWVFGCNAYGQLGNDSTKKRSTPEVVALPEPAVRLSCGYFCCLALLRSGRVFRWGLDPQSVRLGAQALKKNSAAAAAATAAAKTQTPATNGGVTTGTGASQSKEPVANNGQKTVDLIRPSDSDPRPSVTVKLTGATPPSNSKPATSQNTESSTAVQAGTFTPENRDHLCPSEVDTSQVEGRVVDVAAGSQHTVYLTTGGKLYSQGRNLDGQLGVGGRQEAPKLQEVPLPDDLRPVSVACGADYTLVLTEEGAVFGCGSNSYAQLAKLPAADRLDDAKLVLLKNRRLLRLPQGQNSADKLQVAVSADSQRNAPLQVAFGISESHTCAMSRETGYGSDAERLHAVLRLFPGCYRPSQLLTKCQQMECLYAAARVCAVSGQPAAALQHHLAAVQRDTPERAELEEAAAQLVTEYLALADGSVAGALLLRKLLLHLVTFWLDAELSMTRLERVLETQLEKLAHPLAVLLFGGSADMQLSDSRIAAVFGGLSTAFCVRLCAMVCEQIAAGRICRELLPMLGDLALPSVRGSSPRPAQTGSSSDSVMDSVICQLLRHRENSVHLSAEAVEAHLDAEDPADPATSKLVVFSCGHSCSVSQLHADQLPRLRLGLSQLPRTVPRTAELLMAQYRDLRDAGAACPDCVLEYVARCVQETVPSPSQPDVTSDAPAGGV